MANRIKIQLNHSAILTKGEGGRSLCPKRIQLLQHPLQFRLYDPYLKAVSLNIEYNVMSVWKSRDCYYFFFTPNDKITFMTTALDCPGGRAAQL